MYDAEELSHEVLREILTPASAKPLDLRRIKGAIKSQHLARQHTGDYEATQSPMFQPQDYPSICGWLDSVKGGYSRFAAAFAAAGYEDLEDLRADRPTPEKLEAILAETTVAKSPQVENLVRALAALSSTGGAAGQSSTHTPHKYLPAGPTYVAAPSSDHVDVPSAGTATSTPLALNDGHARASAPATAAAATPFAGAAAAAGSGAVAAGRAVASPPLQPNVRTKRMSMLPNGKHAFLSYQWDVQDSVVKIKKLLNERNVKCWMDIDGGMKSDIYDSVSI